MEKIRKTKILRELLSKDKIIIAPGRYDGLSAKIIELLGFEVVYITGGGASASVLGVPDIGLVTMSEMVRVARNIVNAVNLPVISDADTGYGNPINVMPQLGNLNRQVFALSISRIRKFQRDVAI